MKEKTCLDCGEELIGRIDKKFCNDLCRNSYNNKLNKDTSNLVRNINNILRRNRRILAEFTPTATGKAKIPKEKLILKGFNFNFYTSIYTTKTGNVYYFCYEYGYLNLEDDYLALVKNERGKE